MTSYRYLDITGEVDCTQPAEVLKIAQSVVLKHHPQGNVAVLQAAFTDIEALYAGTYPGYRGCDMAYHDLPHVLDVTLALCRLVDGYQSTHAQDSLFFDEEQLVAAIIIALFHDVGYLRRAADHRATNGAEYTRVHVRRGGKFLSRYFAELGLKPFSRIAARLIQFTGYEVDLSTLTFADARLRNLGELIGTADILAQMSDRNYLDKCRDCLYPEFVLGGMIEYIDDDGTEKVRYRDAEDLLRQTPGFMKSAIEYRLGEMFHESYRYIEVLFDGRNPYLEAINTNYDSLQAALSGRPGKLSGAFNPDWIPGPR